MITARVGITRTGPWVATCVRSGARRRRRRPRGPTCRRSDHPPRVWPKGPRRTTRRTTPTRTPLKAPPSGLTNPTPAGRAAAPARTVGGRRPPRPTTPRSTPAAPRPTTPSPVSSTAAPRGRPRPATKTTVMTRTRRGREARRPARGARGSPRPRGLLARWPWWRGHRMGTARPTRRARRCRRHAGRGAARSRARCGRSGWSARAPRAWEGRTSAGGAPRARLAQRRRPIPPHERGVGSTSASSGDPAAAGGVGHLGADDAAAGVVRRWRAWPGRRRIHRPSSVRTAWRRIDGLWSGSAGPCGRRADRAWCHGGAGAGSHGGAGAGSTATGTDRGRVRGGRGVGSTGGRCARANGPPGARGGAGVERRPGAGALASSRPAGARGGAGVESTGPVCGAGRVERPAGCGRR